MKTAQNKEISFCFLLSKSATWILWRYQTANFDTDVGNTKTVPKNFNYYSLYTCPPLFYFLIFTARKRSLGKVVFSQASVCPRGRGSPWQRPPGQRPPGQIPPPRQRPPWTETPWKEILWTETLPHGKEWAVRILLECILVVLFFFWHNQLGRKIHKSGK